MGILDWAKNQFIEIIEWQDDSRDTVAWRFPVYRNEIKYGAQLTVREGQIAVFLNEGTCADVFGPGRYELTTKNLPVLATLKGWKYGFESPFKADVTFVATRRFTDLKWGTLNPVMLRDADFGVLRLRAFGTYALKVTDGKAFVRELAGTDSQVLIGALQDHLRNKLVARFTDTLGEAGIPALDLASRYDEIAAGLAERINAELGPQGASVVDLHVENISLPPEVEQALDARSKMNVIGDLGKYTQFKTAESVPIAAGNPGIGGAGIGLGLGAGIGAVLGQQVAGALQPGAPRAPDAFAAPVAGAAAAGGAVRACATCQATLAPAAKFCPECGSPAPSALFCVGCGKPLAPGAKFCPDCGTKAG
jgi:membrane protease subunit (stomatin/prohibitin family)